MHGRLLVAPRLDAVLELLNARLGPARVTIHAKAFKTRSVGRPPNYARNRVSAAASETPLIRKILREEYGPSIFRRLGLDAGEIAAARWCVDPEQVISARKRG
jgi:hypothetical protein